MYNKRTAARSLAVFVAVRLAVRLAFRLACFAGLFAVASAGALGCASSLKLTAVKSTCLLQPTSASLAPSRSAE